MNLTSLAQDELPVKAARKDIALQVGPFTVKVSSNIAAIPAGLDLLYGQNQIIGNDFFDFHVSINQPRFVRALYRPQVNFSLDGVKPFKPLPRSQALAMFEWGLNWCITNYCHDYLIVHAAVVEKNGKVLMLPAPPGAGKSTLCAALVCSGWRLLSDELALLSLSGDNKITPLARPVCLKNGSIDVIKQHFPEATFGPLCLDTSKGTVAHMAAPAESLQRVSDPAQLQWVVFPRFQPGSETLLSDRPRATTFFELARQSFNYHVLSERAFDTLEAAISTAHCFDFQYSNLTQAIDTFDSMADCDQSMETA